MIRKATAVWTGTLKEGSGNLTTDSGVLKGTAYSFHARFEDGQGTNPEELIAAAHSGCFAMALSGALGSAGFTADSINVEAQVEMEQVNGAPTVTKSHLVLTASVPGIEEEQFDVIAQDTKLKCPISRLLNAEISLEAKLNQTTSA